MEHLGEEKKSQTAHLDAFWGDFQLTTDLALAELTDVRALQTRSTSAGRSFRDFCVDVDPVLNRRDESPEGFTASQGHRPSHRDNMQLYTNKKCVWPPSTPNFLLHELCPNSPK